MRTCQALHAGAARPSCASEFGLDQSMWQQYVIYLSSSPRGTSAARSSTQQPVCDELWNADQEHDPDGAARAPILSIVFGILLGVLSAWRRGTSTDSGEPATSASAFYSMPTQWLGLMLVIMFAGDAADVRASPTRSCRSPTPALWTEFVDRLQHMLLPALTLGLTLFGEYTLIMRSAMLETLGEDYVLTARAKGLRNWTIVRKHALRNSLLPISTLIALSLGYIIGGAILVETVFTYPGIGLADLPGGHQPRLPGAAGRVPVLTRLGGPRNLSPTSSTSSSTRGSRR